MHSETSPCAHLPEAAQLPEPDCRPEPADLPEAADLLRRLAEPYAFALLLWPAVGALMLSWPAEPWTDYARAALWLWLAGMQLAAYTGGRGAGFGNAVALTNLTVAAAVAAFPSPWALASLPVLLVTLYAAQRLRIGLAASEATSLRGHVVSPAATNAESRTAGSAQC